MSRGDFVKNSIFSQFNANTVVDSNVLVSTFYEKQIMELATNRFKWNGLPETIDPRFLEMVLYTQALAIFFKHPDNDAFCAWRGMPIGPSNAQDNFTKFQAIGTIERPVSLNVDNCVPMWANYVRVPDYDMVSIYTKQLVDTNASINIAIKNSRHPVVLVSDQSGSDRLGLANAYRQVQEGQPVIGWYKDSGMGDSLRDKIIPIELGTKAEDITILQIAKTRIFSELMTFLGIDNSNQDKRERLVSDEVDANDSQISHFRRIALNAREQACEQINKMFDLDISVEWNEEKIDPETTMEGEDNGGPDDDTPRDSK